MARPRLAKKRYPVPARDGPTSSESEQDGGSQQSHRVADRVQTAKEMLNAGKRRREVKLKAIKMEHAQQLEKVRAKIVSHYEDRRNRIDKAQTAQWDQLAALLKSRRSIEAGILKQLKTIEQMTLNLSSALNAMYEGRLEEIAELNTTGRVTISASAEE